MYSALRFYHCANIPASTVPSHVPRSHGSALRFRSFQLRFTAQAAAVLPLSPGSLNSASQPKQSQSRQSQLCLITQAVTVQAFYLSVLALSTPPHSPSSYSPSIPPPSPGSLSSVSQHDTDKVFFSFIADFLQGFLDLNANIIRHSCVSQIVFKALDQIL